MRQSVLCGNFHMHASTGFTYKCFVQKIRAARNGFTHWLLETENDIVNYTNIIHSNFSGRVVEDQWCIIFWFNAHLRCLMALWFNFPHTRYEVLFNAYFIVVVTFCVQFAVHAQVMKSEAKLWQILDFRTLCNFYI